MGLYNSLHNHFYFRVILLNTFHSISSLTFLLEVSEMFKCKFAQNFTILLQCKVLQNSILANLRGMHFKHKRDLHAKHQPKVAF